MGGWPTCKCVQRRLEDCRNQLRWLQRVGSDEIRRIQLPATQQAKPLGDR
jgi:hypothetical protein